jgi:NADPH-dependent 2,4-dienoyl-CoA reductase/sulfur reductase-like enzyme
VPERIGPETILGVRLGCSDFIPGGLEFEEAVRIAARLPLDAIDYFHTSAGTSESNDYTIQPLYHGHAPLRSMAEKLRADTGRCVILTGSVTRVELAEELLLRGEADLIGMGRPLLADPLLPRKAAAGRTEEVRPCIRCNQGCLSRVRKGRTIRCAVNPRLGYEWMGGDPGGHAYRHEPRRTILVAGGGPAGMTAALRCVDQGCEVILCEREHQLGGLLSTTLSEPLKQDIADYLAFLRAAVDRSGATVKREFAVDVALLERHAPDIFIDATGSIPVVPPREEPGPYLVVDAREALRSLDEFARKGTAVVIGGGSAGCEIAYGLASRGAATTVIEQAPEILGDLDPASALALRRLLERSGVIVRRNASFRTFGCDGVMLHGDASPLRAELVVVAMGSRPSTQFTCLDRDGRWIQGVNLLHVGDTRKVGKIFEAVHDTYWLVSALFGHGTREPASPATSQPVDQNSGG